LSMDFGGGIFRGGGRPRGAFPERLFSGLFFWPEVLPLDRTAGFQGHFSDRGTPGLVRPFFGVFSGPGFARGPAGPRGASKFSNRAHAFGFHQGGLLVGPGDQKAVHGLGGPLGGPNGGGNSDFRVWSGMLFSGGTPRGTDFSPIGLGGVAGLPGELPGGQGPGGRARASFEAGLGAGPVGGGWVLPNGAGGPTRKGPARGGTSGGTKITGGGGPDGGARNGGGGGAGAGFHPGGPGRVLVPGKGEIFRFSKKKIGGGELGAPVFSNRNLLDSFPRTGGGQVPGGGRGPGWGPSFRRGLGGNFCFLEKRGQSVFLENLGPSAQIFGFVSSPDPGPGPGWATGGRLPSGPRGFAVLCAKGISSLWLFWLGGARPF